MAWYTWQNRHSCFEVKTTFYLSHMKTTYQNSRMVRKPEFPLQQIIRRLSEQVFFKKDAISYLVLKGAHMDGPLLDSLINGDQFKSVSTQKYKLKVKKKIIAVE